MSCSGGARRRGLPPLDDEEESHAIEYLRWAPLRDDRVKPPAGLPRARADHRFSAATSNVWNATAGSPALCDAGVTGENDDIGPSDQERRELDECPRAELALIAHRFLGQTAANSTHRPPTGCRRGECRVDPFV
jgi:hypothetical protein